MSELTKIFFGLLDNNKVLESKDIERGFWGFEEDFLNYMSL